MPFRGRNGGVLLQEVRYMICHWATNRTDPQNLLTMTLDVPLHYPPFYNQ